MSQFHAIPVSRDVRDSIKEKIVVNQKGLSAKIRQKGFLNL